MFETEKVKNGVWIQDIWPRSPRLQLRRRINIIRAFTLMRASFSWSWLALTACRGARKQEQDKQEEQPNVTDPNSKTNLSGKCGFKTYSVWSLTGRREGKRKRACGLQRRRFRRGSFRRIFLGVKMLAKYFSRVLLLNISFPTFYWSEELKEITHEVLNVRNRNFANSDWLSSVVQKNAGCVRGNQSGADRAVCLLRSVSLAFLRSALCLLPS